VTYQIRALSIDDLAELRAWWYWSGNTRLAPLYRAESFSYVLSRYAGAWLVSDEGQSIAYLDLQRVKGEGRVRLCVKAGHPTGELLAAMLAYVEQQAAALGMTRLTLKIPRRAFDLRGAAIRAGFEQRGQTHRYDKYL